MTVALETLLADSARRHHHLCPRQVLGARMGLWAGELLAVPVPQPAASKRLLVIAETDGCFLDGLTAATNCWAGRRTLRIEDYGKLAATFVDTTDGRALRLAPQAAVRERAGAYAPEAPNRWEAYLLGYQRMPADELFRCEPVALRQTVAELVSRFRARAVCAICGEEINNEREVQMGEQTVCRACAHGGYYSR